MLLVMFLGRWVLRILLVIAVDVYMFIANLRWLDRWVQVMLLSSIRSTQIRCCTFMVVVAFWVVIFVVILLFWGFFQVGVE